MWYASLLDLRTQFNKGRTCEEIIRVSLKIQEAAIKKCSYRWEKKVTQYVRKIEYMSQVHFPTKFVPDIVFTDEPIAQYDVLVVGDAAVNEWK